MDYLYMIWSFLNTPLGYVISGFIILFIINKIFDAKPSWAKYESLMIGAIKMAENFIPDGTENKGLAKADKALEYFITSYTKAKGKPPSKKVIQNAMLGMSSVHEKIEHTLIDKKVANK